MLPKQRVGIGELWAKLSEKRSEVGHANGWPTNGWPLAANGHTKVGNGIPNGSFGGRRR